MILDEPFSGLDPIHRDLLRDLILEMKRSGKTVIFSTHVMEQAEELCDFVFMINKGRKVQDGTLAEVKASGGEAIKLDFDGDASFVKSLPAVERFEDKGKSGEIFLRPGADPQELLQVLFLEVKLLEQREN